MSDQTTGRHTAERVVYDERVGCVAVYHGEERNCLSGVESDALCYKQGEWVEPTWPEHQPGHWRVDPQDCADLRRAAASWNACLDVPVEALEEDVVATLARTFASTICRRCDTSIGVDPHEGDAVCVACRDAKAALREAGWLA